jgi:branched-chain amino acid transport system ATP-binding protein
LLKVQDIHTYYGESYILHGVSLEVEKGTTVALLGRNGMGKTTAVRSIMGLTPPRRGKITFNEEDITRLAPFQIARRGLAFIPQGRCIFPSLTVRENLVVVMRGTGYDLEKIYSFFPILKDRSNNQGDQLSGGEQQMLAIARAMLANPEFIVMDEASEGLAPAIIKQIGDFILHLKSTGQSILLVEQNLALALRVSDYVYVLHHGEIVLQCSATEFAKDSKAQMEFIGTTTLNA